MVVASAVTPTLLGRPTGDLYLRVLGTHYDGRIVRLSSAKCTVGSGPRCTLRLRAPGIDPVHCLILRGGERTIVRRWSPNTRLNGRAFQDAPLVPGDRLSLGCLEFEVLSGANDNRGTEQGHTTEGSTQAGEHNVLSARLAEIERENRDLTFALAKHRGEWNAQRQEWEEERRAADGALANRWRQLEVWEAELEARRQQTDTTDRSAGESDAAELENLRRELDEERRQSEEQHNAWLQERQATEAELTARAHRLEEEANQLLARRHELDETQAKLAQQMAEIEESRRQLDAQRDSRQENDETQRQLQGAHRQNEEQHTAWQQERQAAETELTARSQRLDEEAKQLAARHRDFEAAQAKLVTQTAEVEELQRQLDAERDTWHETRDETKRRLAERSQALDETAAELNRRSQELEDRQEELTRLRVELDEAAAQQERQGSARGERADEPQRSSEANDLLARLRELQSYQPEKDDETGETGISDDAEAPIDEEAALENPVEQRSEPRDAGDDEESIEDYMARLIHRMRGSDDKHQARRTGKTPKPATEEPRQQAEAQQTPAQPEPEAPQKLSASEFVPRSSAPEQTAGLSAMRELANLSARTAIGTHSKTRSSREANHKVIMAGAAASLGLVLLFWSEGDLTLIAGAVLGFGFSVYCAWQAIAHAGNARKTTDTNVAGKDFTFTAPHERLWVKLLPHLQRYQDRLQEKWAALRKKK